MLDIHSVGFAAPAGLPHYIVLLVVVARTWIYHYALSIHCEIVFAAAAVKLDFVQDIKPI